jgi:hypothetical protein
VICNRTRFRGAFTPLRVIVDGIYRDPPRNRDCYSGLGPTDSPTYRALTLPVRSQTAVTMELYTR